MGIHDGKKFAAAVAPASVQRALPADLPDILIVDVMCNLYAMQSMAFDTPADMARTMLRDALRFQGVSRLVLVADKRRLKELTAPKGPEAKKRADAMVASYVARGLPIPTPYPDGVEFTERAVLVDGERVPLEASRVIETVRRKQSTMAWWSFLKGFVERRAREWPFTVECRFDDIGTDDAEVPFGTYGEADLEIVHFVAFDVFEGSTVFVLTLDTDFMAHFFLYKHLLNEGVTVWWIQDAGHWRKPREDEIGTGSTGDDGATETKVWEPPWVMHMPTFCETLAHVPPLRFAEICLLLGTDFVERKWWVKGVTAVNAGSMAVDPEVVAGLARVETGRMGLLAGHLVAAFRERHPRKFDAVPVTGVAAEAFQRALTYWSRAIPSHVDRWGDAVAALRANML